MRPDQIAAIMNRYGYAMRSVQPVQKGYRNQSYAVLTDTGETVNLIVYKSELHILERIRNAHYLGEQLMGLGFPVRVPVDQRIIRLHSTRQTVYGALYNYLSGSTIPWEAYTMEHLKALGACLGQMHRKLAIVERAQLPLVTDELSELYHCINDYFNRPEVRLAMVEKLGIRLQSSLPDYSRLFQQLARQIDCQPLHMDFVRGNILFTDQKAISGVIDFEKAAWGLPIIDVARTLAFLLVDCRYKSAEQTTKYFLLSGYHKRGGNKLYQGRLLEVLVSFFLLHDLYKFLHHNPYEFLSRNEHYIRTRDQLLGRRLIFREQ